MATPTVCMANQLNVPKGSSKTFELTVKDGDGVRVDITGAKLWFCVREKPGCPVLIEKKNDLAGGSIAEIEVTDAVNGEARIYLSPSDTDKAPATPELLEIRQYLYDIWIELASGKRYQVVAPSILQLTKRICEIVP